MSHNASGWSTSTIVLVLASMHLQCISQAKKTCILIITTGSSRNNQRR